MGIFGFGGTKKPTRTPEELARQAATNTRRPGETDKDLFGRILQTSLTEAEETQAATTLANVTPTAPPSVAEAAAIGQAAARDKAALARRRAQGGSLLLAGQPGGRGLNPDATLRPQTLVGS